MSLEFYREVIIVNGFPIMGTITVEAEIQDEIPYFYTMAFEPETPVPGLLWSAVEAPLKEWMTANRDRVLEETFKRW